ncbi:hypothetical protein AGABI1DRAFT_126627 [Agaricus bisporus var. burnettii JB137-S8]|uniref:Uncharacterized protein n=1 Tax=Agaricus bisporus var. burnettii (strain JB137-S8 / ATCC MYA-4627 / FGSC 10392) TaxID=597362 RepID=K5WYK5_AGABU|nr:uncharacterized protein AGABI1DRAFT_126627 [Agaricus bisporus var. burnettii JB137-S8]EKM80566.1 hypothetical protein AGABI1DRAFT_126627 [Agaricus bisporus var. burnettii JB137-S8]
MFKPNTPPPHNNRLSTETTATIISPPSDDAQERPPLPSPPREAQTLQEIAWQASLRNLEHQMISYQNHATESGGASEQDVERVAIAMENVANCHPNPKAKAQWKKKAKKFRKADPKGRDGALKSIAKGFLILLTSPLYILGAAFWATGTIFGGFGSAFKGAGRLTKKLSYTGNSLKPKPNAY